MWNVDVRLPQAKRNPVTAGKNDTREHSYLLPLCVVHQVVRRTQPCIETAAIQSGCGATKSI
jgi:hypothetical protein